MMRGPILAHLTTIHLDLKPDLGPSANHTSNATIFTESKPHAESSPKRLELSPVVLQHK